MRSDKIKEEYKISNRIFAINDIKIYHIFYSIICSKLIVCYIGSYSCDGNDDSEFHQSSVSIDVSDAIDDGYGVGRSELKRVLDCSDIGIDGVQWDRSNTSGEQCVRQIVETGSGLLKRACHYDVDDAGVRRVRSLGLGLDAGDILVDCTVNGGEEQAQEMVRSCGGAHRSHASACHS